MESIGMLMKNLLIERGIANLVVSPSLAEGELLRNHIRIRG